MGFSDSVGFINEYIAKKSDDLNKTIFSASNHAKSSAQGQLQKQTEKRVSNPAIRSIAINPLINMGIDTATQAVTQVSQQLVASGAQKVEATVNKVVGIPVRTTLDNAMQSYFTIVGLASTASIEIIMEIARTNARLIVKFVKQKEDLINKIRPEVIALYNAVVILTNAPPYFKNYFAKIITAYNKINTANSGFKSVSSRLTTTHKYNSVQYDTSLKLLVEARDLILPENSANVNEIRSGTLLENVILRKSNKDAVAAALTIPGISTEIGKLYLLYVAKTLEINLLITLFTKALSTFIETYKRNDNLDKSTIAQIKAGTNQLDSLLADMQVVLFPTDGREKKSLYSGEVTTSATGWGMRLTTIIEWMKIQPGAASKELDVTGESTRRYARAVELLNAQGDISIGLATLKVSGSKEDTLSTTVAVANILFFANTVVVTQNKPKTARAQVLHLNSLLDAAHILDTNIVNALTPFINTPFNLLNGADKVVKQLSVLSKNLGMDRAADLLASADIKGFYAMNASTASYAGAAVLGVSGILSALSSTPNATQKEVSSLEVIRDSFNIQNQTNQVEVSRTSSSSVSAFVAQQTSNFSFDKRNADEAIAVASGKDPAVANSPLKTAENSIQKAIGNKFKFKSFP